MLTISMPYYLQAIDARKVVAQTAARSGALAFRERDLCAHPGELQ